MQPKFALVLVGIVALLGLAACQRAQPGDAVVTVTMDEWSLQPSLTSVRAGKVTFQVINRGNTEHELVVVKTDRGPKDLVMRADGTKVDEDASGQNVGEIEEVAAGQTKTGTFDLAPGHYVLTCNQPEHYQQGMVAAFEVR